MQLELHQRVQMLVIADRRRSASQFHREEYRRQIHPNYDPVTDNMRGSDDDDSVDAMEYCCTEVNGENTAASKETFQCSKCKHEFPIWDHELLLEHTSECI